ncbi:toprim domain-containing protein [Pedobacter panaciterrae]|uniref:toprim domain-containing protein n=1 Tax=Pedobacter panaciterrae TaxID=363849 RepID=UPI0025918BCF|nr:toprim domain-containing protein [uncultured Pedobacter sp.]
MGKAFNPGLTLYHIPVEEIERCVMGLGNEKMTCRLARELDIVDFLAGQGIRPVKINGNDYWYHSPLREERTPSFKVNRKINRWFDFGEGIGGNLVDLGIRLYQCTVSNFLEILEGAALPDTSQQKRRQIPNPSGNKVEEIAALSSSNLLTYLQNRSIPLSFGQQYLDEVKFRWKGKRYRALGFKNDSGGWELRNEFYKSSISPKGSTYINRGNSRLAVFEGFFDFLSYLVLFGDSAQPADFLILNSLSFFESSRELMEGYREVQLFLDNDKAGREKIAYAITLSDIYHSQSSAYCGYKDLNDFLCGIAMNALPSDHQQPPGWNI